VPTGEDFDARAAPRHANAVQQPRRDRCLQSKPAWVWSLMLAMFSKNASLQRPDAFHFRCRDESGHELGSDAMASCVLRHVDAYFRDPAITRTAGTPG